MIKTDKSQARGRPEIDQSLKKDRLDPNQRLTIARQSRIRAGPETDKSQERVTQEIDQSHIRH